MSQAAIKAQLATQVGTLSPPYVASTVQDALALALYNSMQVGIITGVAPAAGEIGEILQSTRLVAARVTGMVTATVYDVNTLSLTAGEWVVSCLTAFGETPTSAILCETGIGAGANAAAAYTASVDGTDRCGVTHPGNTAAGYAVPIVIPPFKVALSATTVYRQVAKATFTAGTQGVWGRLTAQRIR